MAMTCAQAKKVAPKDKDYRLSDGNNLYLLVKKTGPKYWRMKCRLARKEKMLAIGRFPEVSIKEARERRDEARGLLRQGVDPVQHYKNLK